jgi:outer membrane cobalamin receptor
MPKVFMMNVQKRRNWIEPIFMSLVTAIHAVTSRRLLCAGLIVSLFFLFPPCLTAADDPPEEASIERLMSMSLEELINVEITVATRSPKLVRKAPAIASVITAKEIHNMGARNLLDVLKMIPGFGVSLNEWGAAMIEVRGVRTLLSEKILVMIDGHSLNRNFTGTAFHGEFEDLPVENIKQIEVIRGPGSALYGANAFVAVLNIITRDAHEINGLEVKTSLGSFATRKIDLTGGKVFQNGLALSASLDYYETDGPALLVEQDSTFGTPWAVSPGYTDMRHDRADLLVKASWKDFSYQGHFMNKNLDGLYIGFGYALTDDNTFEYNYYTNELSYRRELTERLLTNIKLFYDHFDQGGGIIEIQPEGFLVGVIPPGFPDGMYGGPYVKNDMYGGEIQLDYDLNDTNHVIAGALYEKLIQYDVRRISNYAPPTATVPVPVPIPGGVQDTSSTVDINWNRDADREIWAVYVQDELTIRENVNLTVGARYDHYSDFGSTINPRAGLVWGFMKNGELKLLYGQAFRAPDFGELYTENNVSSMGNPNLGPEKIKTYEAALGLTPTNSLSVDISYFYNKVEDLIRTTPTVPAYFINQGTAEINGIELVVNGRYTPDNYWSLSYTYQDPRDGETKARLPDVPYHRAAGSINYGLTRYLTIHADLLWTGERPRPAGDTRAKVDAYTTVDLALTLKNFYKTMEIQGVIHNLFDQDYVDPDRSGALQLVPNDFPRSGISGTVNVSYKF